MFKWAAGLALMSVWHIAGPTSAGATALGDFQDLHRCAILERLDQIHASKGQRDGKDRHLIVSKFGSLDRFVQCIFFDDDKRMLCEAASGFYLTRPGQPRRRLVSARALDEIAKLGFSTDDSQGNYSREVETPGPADFVAVANLMLSALFLGYGARAGQLLKFDAPLARDGERITSRCRTVS